MAKPPYPKTAVARDFSPAGVHRFYRHDGGRQIGYEEDGRPFPPQQPQDKSMQHGERYDNDVRGWTRGASGKPSCYGESAEGKPFFDKSPPRDKMRR
jgi:hypothetical protein